MARLTSGDFGRLFSAQGASHSLNARKLLASQQVQAAISNAPDGGAAFKAAVLAAAGPSGEIATPAQIQALFKAIDDFDNNGDAGSVETQNRLSGALSVPGILVQQVESLYDVVDQPPAPADPAAARTLAEAKSSFASLVALGAKLSVTTSAGNGGRPVLTIVPPSLARNTDATKPYDVEVHYHGMFSHASAPNASSPMKQRIADSFANDPPTVYVLPEWAADNDWSNVRDTGSTATDATRGITGTAGQLTVSAHSLARNAITSAIDHGGLTADRLDIQDAFFRTQPSGPQKVAKWATDNPAAKVRVLTTTGSSANPSADAMSDMRTIKSQASWPSNVVFDDRSRLGDHWAADLMPMA